MTYEKSYMFMKNMAAMKSHLVLQIRTYREVAYSIAYIFQALLYYDRELIVIPYRI